MFVFWGHNCRHFDFIMVYCSVECNSKTCFPKHNYNFQSFADLFFKGVMSPLSPGPPSSQVRQFLTQLFTIWSHSSRPRYIPLFRPSLSSLSLFAPLLLPSLIPPPFFPIHLSFLSFLPFSLLHRPLPMCFCILYSPHVPQNFWRADLRQLQLPGMKLRQLSHSLTLENPSARKLRQLRQSLTLENLLLKL